MPGRRKMQVQAPDLAQEQVAKSRTAILCAVMVVLRTAAGHQGDVARGQRLSQTERVRPVRHRLHTVPVVRPARARQGQCLDISSFQAQAQRGLPLPICQQPCGGRRHVDRAREHDMAHASTANGFATPAIGSQRGLHTVRWRGRAHRTQCNEARSSRLASLPSKRGPRRRTAVQSLDFGSPHRGRRQQDAARGGPSRASANDFQQAPQRITSPHRQQKASRLLR
jgi:hypothetical protein